MPSLFKAVTVGSVLLFFAAILSVIYSDRQTGKQLRLVECAKFQTVEVCQSLKLTYPMMECLKAGHPAETCRSIVR